MKAQLIACCLLVACTPQEENLGNRPGGSLPPGSMPVGSPRWAVDLGSNLGSGFDYRGLGVAIDSIGDVVAVGEEQGEPNSVGINEQLGYVTKRTASDGSERWTVPITPQADLSYVAVVAVALDAHDSIYVTGNYIGTADFGGQTLSLVEPPTPSHGDTFLAKYSWDGHLQWVHGLDPATDSQGIALAIDSEGRILLTGAFGHGALTFAGHQYVADADADADTYLVAFDPNGTVLWGTAFKGAGGPTPGHVAVAANGDVWVAGTFSAPATFGGATLDPGSYYRAFLTRYRKDGLFLSSQVVGTGGAGTSSANSVAVSSTGQIIVQTVEQEVLDTQHPTFGAVHVFDDSANEISSYKQLDHGSYSPQLRTLAISPSGVIMSSAWNDGPSDVDHPDQVHGSMQVDVYDPDGNTGSASFGDRTYGGTGQTMPWASAVGATGAIAYTGQFCGTVELGMGSLATHTVNDTDAFIVLLDPPAP